MTMNYEDMIIILTFLGVVYTVRGGVVYDDVIDRNSLENSLGFQYVTYDEGGDNDLIDTFNDDLLTEGGVAYEYLDPVAEYSNQNDYGIDAFNDDRYSDRFDDVMKQEQILKEINERTNKDLDKISDILPTNQNSSSSVQEILDNDRDNSIGSLFQVMDKSDTRSRRRREDISQAESDQFRCVGGGENLMKIWSIDKITAILEYIDLTRNSNKPCQIDWCTAQVDFSPYRQNLDQHFSDQVSGSIQVVNTINSILHYEKERLGDSIYIALGRGLLQGERKVLRVTVMFHNGKAPDRSIVVQGNLTTGGDQGTTGGDWPSPSIYSEFIQSHSQACAEVGSGAEVGLPVTTTQGQGHWGKPSVHCKSGLRSWNLPYFTPFFTCSSNQLTLRGMLRVDMSLTDYDINQCSMEKRDPFYNSHKCPENFKCLPQLGHGFRSGSYRCDCLLGYHDNTSFPLSFPGSSAQLRHVQWLLGNGNDVTDAQCVPCSAGCLKCYNSSTRCLLMYDSLTRGIPLGIESLCITLCVALTFATVHLRKTKVMKASFWCLLEILIIGAILLHLTIVVQYFEPTELLCLLVPWLRELGFTVVYGSLILKVYRVLTGFQSRKAHRVQVRDKDLFKYLCCMIVICVSFMAAWTAVTFDNNSSSSSALLEFGYTEDNLKYVVCRATWWDYVVEIGELTFILFGVYLCYRARSAPSACRELYFITIAICNETIVSAIFYIVRHAVWLTLHPDYLFLLYFLRCQITITVLILLVFGPKLWYIHHPSSDEPRRRAYSGCDLQIDNSTSCAEAVKLNSTTACIGSNLNPNGDVDVAEINLSDMNPDDIRTELKRLYTQLQIYKTKTMRQDNPHISKRRGGRKNTHRRFSLQAFHSKHHRHHHSSGAGSDRGFGSDRGEISVDRGDTEVSRTPEESTNSAEGVSIYMDEPSVGGMPVVAETTVRTPTVTFKSTERLRGK